MNFSFSRFRSLVQWFGSARRAQPQERIPPEQLRMALTEMLADPRTRRLLLEDLVGPGFPIQGGVCNTPAGDVAPGAFGAGCAPGDYSFPAKVGIATTAPVRKLDVHETGIDVVAARLAGLGTPPDYSRNVALSFHPRVDFLPNDSARIEARLTGGTPGSESADLALQTRAAGTLSTKMLIEAGGNVGIGTTPGPGVRVDVAGGGVRSQGSAGGNHAFLGSFVNGTFTNWLNTGDNATFYNLLGGPDQHSGFGVAEGPNIVSPIVWMYAAGGRNMFDVRSVGYQQNPTAGTSLFTVRESGNVGIGTSSPQSKINVKGSASFTASGTVAVTDAPPPPPDQNRIVTGTGTSFTTQVAVGDRISVTVGGKTATRTVISIASNTSLKVDAVYHVAGSGLTMTVLPSIFRGDNASGTPTPQFTVTGDGHAVIGTPPSTPPQPLSGFLGLGGTRIHNDDDVGYVVCFFDNEGNPFLNTNNEMRGFNATMRYTRTTPDGKEIIGGRPLGWDVFGHGGAVSLEGMNFQNIGNVNTSVSGSPPVFTVTWVSGANFSWASAGQHININGTDYVIQSKLSDTSLTLQTSAGTQNNVPYADVNIRGQMKPFQSELYFKAKATGAKNYHVQEPAFNYLASLTAVDATSAAEKWAGYFVDSPCSVCGAPNGVTTGYGVWIENLADNDTLPNQNTLVESNAAAIKIDGLDNYGRIQWTNTSIYEVSNGAHPRSSTGVLEFSATTAVQTKSGVSFNVGGSAGNAICNAGGFRIGGAAPSGNYLRGNGTNFVSSPIQAADVPDLDASKITTGVFSTLRIPDLDASKIVSGTIADARLPASLVRSLDGNPYKIKFGSALVSGNGSLVISTGLSSIAAVLITHIFTMTNAAAGSVANVSGGNFTLYNDLGTEEYFYWLAIGTA